MTYVLWKQLAGHSGEVRCATVLDNGWVVTGGYDAACGVWAIDGGGLVRMIHGHSDFVYAVCAAGNSSQFFSASKDRQIILFDAETGNKILTFDRASKEHSGPICSLVRCGSSLASGSWDGSICEWELNGSLLRKISAAGSHATVLAVDRGLLVSGSQDSALRWWANGALVKEVKNAHSDIIRAITPTPAGNLVTCSNDCSLKLWQGDAELAHLHGHSNFVFSVSSSDSELASSGEDRSVKIWALHSLNEVQSIAHPATVWFALLVDGGRLVTGCADGIVRVFSKSLFASQEEQNAFAELSMVSGGGEQVDPATVAPESEMARRSGKKVGEIKMFKDSRDQVFAYQWSALGAWDKVGLVTQKSSANNRPSKHYSGDQYFPAGSYDYVFDVELGERMALLPVNEQDNPLVSAEKFCARELINKANISQIVDFIKQNVKPVLSQRDTSTPHTSSRHFPPLSPFIFRDAKWPAILAKLKEVFPNPQLEQLVAELQKSCDDFTPAQVNLIHSQLLGGVGKENLFVVLDVWRLFVLAPGAVVMYKNSDGGAAYIQTAVRYLADGGNTGLCAARYLANLFSNSISKWAAVDRSGLMLGPVIAALEGPSCSKQMQLACASVIANLAMSAVEKRNSKSLELASGLLDVLPRLIAQATDPDVVYRLLVALGCLAIVSPNNEKVAAALAYCKDRIEPNIRECCADIEKLGV